MAGEAKTDSFMLGTATVMLGKQADLFDLNESNSIGLVKNVMLKTAPKFTDLTQGVKNTLVYSVMTGNDANVEGEMYEYTGANMSYALGLDGSEVQATTVKNSVKTEMALTSGKTGKALVLNDGTGFAAGDTIFIKPAGSANVMVRKITAFDEPTDTATIDTELTLVIPVGSVVQKVNVVPVGSLKEQPYLSAKIAGKAANGDDIVLLLPKVRMTGGLSLAFKSDNFDHMPLGLSIFDLVSTDPHFGYFQTVGEDGVPAKASLLTPQ